jgi:hypothetical protein
MRTIACVAAAILVGSCNSATSQNTEKGELTLSSANLKVQTKSEFAVQYPKCDEVWKGAKLSPCGREVLKTALKACTSHARQKLGGNPLLIDEYTGDSWQMRAGSMAVRSIEDRGKQMSKQAGYQEPFVFALGNGTNDMEKFYCELDGDMRLSEVVDGGLVPQNPFF